MRCPPVHEALDIPLEDTYLVGTGYGRVTLPFSKEHIRSEILCHGLGAHMMYPGTRTVLDIGGQDTKAIQVDAAGIVENFQMNDRCAAGCGRYLGYIADEMNMGLHELGPLAMKARAPCASTPPARCSPAPNCATGWRWGEAGGHHGRPAPRHHPPRHVDLSRSGGVRDQFTFTGGVAKNEAAVKELRQLIGENYGEVDDQHQSGLDLHRRARGRGLRPPRRGTEGGGPWSSPRASISAPARSRPCCSRWTATTTRWLARRTDRVRQRDPFQLADAKPMTSVLEEAGMRPGDVGYVATTGEGETLDFHTGHFYSMTTHARGAIYLDPEARAALDVGALHGRAIRIDERGKVLSYRMTSQCASGSGQFLENIARYLGIAQDEIGTLSRQADDPEKVSGICAVLAETDVINMVSRGISAPNILKGIHLSMADRLAKLLKTVGSIDGTVLMTGGLALDEGLVAAMQEAMAKEKVRQPIRSHPDSIYAGAIGAALWGAFRHERLARRAAPIKAGMVPASGLTDTNS